MKCDDDILLRAAYGFYLDIRSANIGMEHTAGPVICPQLKKVCTDTNINIIQFNCFIHGDLVFGMVYLEFKMVYAVS